MGIFLPLQCLTILAFFNQNSKGDALRCPYPPIHKGLLLIHPTGNRPHLPILDGQSGGFDSQPPKNRSMRHVPNEKLFVEDDWRASPSCSSARLSSYEHISPSKRRQKRNEQAGDGRPENVCSALTRTKGTVKSHSLPL